MDENKNENPTISRRAFVTLDSLNQKSMPKIGILTKRKYGNLLITSNKPFRDYPNSNSKLKVTYVDVICVCGKYLRCELRNIKNGNTKTCGCSHRYAAKKHGLTSHNKRHPVYTAWTNILQRCYNKKATRFKYWGGRGISVCNEWRNDFMSFYKWAIDNGWQQGLVIDRINNDGNYEPSNCRWTTHLISVLNRRNIKQQ